MFNWGFVGSVGISVKVARELVGSEEQRVAAVYSRNFKHCEKFAKKFNCKPCKSFEEMLNDPEIDGIYIATPHYYHFRYSKMALEKHKPVLCEKPLNLNLKSSEILFDLAKQNNTYFCEAMWTWFNPTANQVKRWIDEGRIGKCATFTGDFSLPTLIFTKKKRLSDNKLGGGAMYDLGVYPICYAYRLFGYPDEIISTGKIKNNIDEKNEIIFKYKSGLECKITSSLLNIGNNSAVIKGDLGTIKIPAMFHESRKAILNGQVKEVYKDLENIKLYERELLFACREIKNGQIESVYMSAKHSLDVMKIMEEVKKQIQLSYELEN